MCYQDIHMHHNFLFDLDQTLLNFHASEHKALGIVITKYGMKFSEDCYTHFKSYNKSLWLELEKGTITRKELFTKRFTDIIEYCGGDINELDPLKINDEFILTMSQNGVPMEGALEFMQKLIEEIPDSRCYIVSNGATINAEGRIRSTGLDKYLEKIYVSEWMGATQPAPEFLDMVLEGVAEPKYTCIVIGDSLTSDMFGAKNAGLASVWFMPEGDIEGAMSAYNIDYCASSFDELLVVLKKWSGTGV